MALFLNLDLNELNLLLNNQIHIPFLCLKGEKVDIFLDTEIILL